VVVAVAAAEEERGWRTLVTAAPPALPEWVRGREARGAETVEPAAWAAWRRESTTGRPTEAGLTEADSAPVGAERWFEVGG